MVAAVIGVIAIGYLDYTTGFEIRLFPLYFLPVALVAWNLGPAVTFALSWTSAVAWFVSNWYAGRVYSSTTVWQVNFLSQLVAFGVVGILVSELRRRLVAEQELARRDPLTGLMNGRAFHEHAKLLFEVARRGQRPITLAYLDLDNFKQVNDERGHEEGDRALQSVAEVMRRELRASDLVARLGGDEFAILLSDSAPEAARSSLDRVRDLVATAMAQSDWPVTASVGAVSYVALPVTLAEAIRRADGVMYRAKQGGKNRVHVEASPAAATAH